jgi:hypothetical protein
VKCRQLPSLVEASGRDEFPGRGTLLLNVAVPVERPVVEFVAGPTERFMPPSRCAVDESENRRHPAPSEVVDLATPSFGVESVPRAGPWLCTWGLFCTALSPLETDWPAPAPLRWIDCCICETCLSNDCGAAAGRDFEKKRCCPPPRGNVEAAAGRLLADNAARVGTTGRFPAIMRPPRKVSPLTPTGVERPVPNWPVGTVDNPPRTLASVEANRKLE